MSAGTRGRISGKTAVLMIAPLVILFLFAFVGPLFWFLLNSAFDPGFTIRHYVRLADEPLYLRVMVDTVVMSAAVTVASLLLGYPIAVLMARLKGFWAMLVAGCVLLPLWTPVLVRTYAWIILLQRRGIVNDGLIALDIIERPLSLLYTPAAVVAAMTHVLLPFMILPIQSSLRAIPPELERAALGLGASRFQAFRYIIWHLSMPGVMAGCLMVFIIALGFYITPALLGGPKVLMVATLVSQQAFQMLDWPFAAAISMVLIVFTLGLAMAFRSVLKLDKLTLHA